LCRSYFTFIDFLARFVVRVNYSLLSLSTTNNVIIHVTECRPRTTSLRHGNECRLQDLSIIGILQPNRLHVVLKFFYWRKWLWVLPTLPSYCYYTTSQLTTGGFREHYKATILYRDTRDIVISWSCRFSSRKMKRRLHKMICLCLKKSNLPDLKTNLRRLGLKFWQI